MKPVGHGYFEHQGKLYREAGEDRPRRVCPECGTAFWPIPYKNRLYDTHACAHRAAARAWRERNPSR